MLDDNNHPYWHTHNYKSWSRNTCCLPSFPIVFLTIWYRFMALFFLMRHLSFSDNLRLKDSINGLGCMFKFDPDCWLALQVHFLSIEATSAIAGQQHGSKEHSWFGVRMPKCSHGTQCKGFA